ncbi:hypothetical protein C1T17_07185 [Sphingobium sp. SCG-1]|uniref:tetratricopeptide repeat protein n=1 Tax=Sphingobium sp. SCG-1 TaxID=2072936 RepID=UPI000CD67599|nr:hypothetical protein [Sphingobium sp. SCG-1]AUW57919.1 hypothetical protein C1T17_07185 [Sphingobium sp. SCG-1]
MVRRSFVMIGAALLSVAMSGAASAGTQSEIGYAPGSLGVSAILSGDYSAAAAKLNSLEGTTKRDPARLINLGNAYAGMGRTYDADRAYRKALKSMPVDLLLADGSVASSHIIAKEALSRLPRTTYALR